MYIGEMLTVLSLWVTSLCLLIFQLSCLLPFIMFTNGTGRSFVLSFCLASCIRPTWHTVLWRKYMQVCVENFAQAVAMMAACWKAVLLRGGWLGWMKAQSFWLLLSRYGRSISRLELSIHLYLSISIRNHFFLGVNIYPSLSITNQTLSNLP